MCLIRFMVRSWTLDCWQPFPTRRSARTKRPRHSSRHKLLERHWDTWMTEEDWVCITERGINTVRILVEFPSNLSIKRHLTCTFLVVSTWTFIDRLLSSLQSWSFCSPWYRFPTVSGGVRRRVAQDCPSNWNSQSLWDRRLIRSDHHLFLTSSSSS